MGPVFNDNFASVLSAATLASAGKAALSYDASEGLGSRNVAIV